MLGILFFCIGIVICTGCIGILLSLFTLCFTEKINKNFTSDNRLKENNSNKHRKDNNNEKI